MEHFHYNLLYSNNLNLIVSRRRHDASCLLDANDYQMHWRTIVIISELKLVLNQLCTTTTEINLLCMSTNYGISRDINFTDNRDFASHKARISLCIAYCTFLLRVEWVYEII